MKKFIFDGITGNEFEITARCESLNELQLEISKHSKIPQDKQILLQPNGYEIVDKQSLSCKRVFVFHELDVSVMNKMSQPATLEGMI